MWLRTVLAVSSQWGPSKTLYWTTNGMSYYRRNRPMIWDIPAILLISYTRRVQRIAHKHTQYSVHTHTHAHTHTHTLHGDSRGLRLRARRSTAVYRVRHLQFRQLLCQLCISAFHLCRRILVLLCASVCVCAMCHFVSRHYSQHVRFPWYSPQNLWIYLWMSQHRCFGWYNAAPWLY